MARQAVVALGPRGLELHALGADGQPARRRSPRRRRGRRMSSASPTRTRPRPSASPAIRFETPRKSATNVGLRLFVDLARRPDLLHAAVGHDRHAVGHRQRLFLVMGDVDEGDPDLLLDRLELDLERAAQLGVEGAERLVEKEDARIEDECAGESDALLLAAGELGRLAAREALQPDECERARRRVCRGPAARRSESGGRRRRCPRTFRCGKSA